jgi:hypothetical protein
VSTSCSNEMRSQTGARQSLSKRRLDKLVALVVALTICNGAIGIGQTTAAGRATLPPANQLQAVRQYIKRTWTVLTRSARDLLRAAPDPKMRLAPGEAWPVYVAPDENRAAIAHTLQAVLPPGDLQHIDLRVLPASVDEIREHGLLYLPHRYVVPGGRFNEMYGWDAPLWLPRRCRSARPQIRVARRG